MKTVCLLLLTFFAFLLPVSVIAQDTHVRTRYVQATKTTIVETDLMYIINTPQQFVQLGLVSRYPGELYEGIARNAYSQPSATRTLRSTGVWMFHEEVLIEARIGLA